MSWSPYNIPTAQDSPLPLTHPLQDKCMASVREGMASEERNDGLTVSILACSHPTSCYAQPLPCSTAGASAFLAMTRTWYIT